MALELVMRAGWENTRGLENCTCWSLCRKDNEFNLTLPSNRVLRRIWNEIFPEEKYRPFRVVSERYPWGCIVATPKYVPLGRRRRFLQKVSENRATGER